jgi:hypothetical protein
MTSMRRWLWAKELTVFTTEAAEETESYEPRLFSSHPAPGVGDLIG